MKFSFANIKKTYSGRVSPRLQSVMVVYRSQYKGFRLGLKLIVITQIGTIIVFLCGSVKFQDHNFS